MQQTNNRERSLFADAILMTDKKQTIHQKGSFTHEKSRKIRKTCLSNLRHHLRVHRLRLLYDSVCLKRNKRDYRQHRALLFLQHSIQPYIGCRVAHVIHSKVIGLTLLGNETNRFQCRGQAGHQ